MKKLLIVISLLTVSLVIPRQTFAHVLLTDGSIGAVLHIDPDDDPIALQQSSFFFDFKDKTGKFDPTQCDCQFVLFENGKQIYSQSLFASNTSPSLTNASVFYTFPKRDVYTLKIIGKPLTQSSFTPFTLSYDIRVSRIGTTSSAPTDFISAHVIHLVGVGLIALFVIFAIIKQTFAERKNKRHTT